MRRARNQPLVVGVPVEGVTTEPAKSVVSVPRPGLGPLIELVPAPIGEVLSWLLKVTAPVPIEVSIGAEDGFVPVVTLEATPAIEVVAAADETLLEIPDDSGTETVPEFVDVIGNVDGNMVKLPVKLVKASETEALFDALEDNEPLPIADRDCGIELGPVLITSLVIVAGGKVEIGPVEFWRGYGPEVRVRLEITEAPVLGPEPVSKVDSQVVDG
ncbi:hypothetical protein NUW58_g582 [Xylaria curta]|uniref:Uncharacterized protein n=1 Tax=Xylaria curta TaxID=42375 RepID=A0ACC1PRP4_9PEZI|nr:hypothetical protein NUW58_g582 [Xylaria curta]